MTSDPPGQADHLTTLLQELPAASPDLPAVLRLIAGARSMFRATDVSLALHDPRAEKASAGRPWFAEDAPEGIEACLRDPMEGHLPLRALRRLGLSTARLEELPGRLSDYGRGSAYARLLATSGRGRVLIGHVGDRQSLGRIEWYRPAEGESFDEEDETRLRLLLPALTAAFRRLNRRLSRHGEVALVNAAGHLLWATDGFRFQWNAGTSTGLRDGRFPLAAMLDDPRFGRAVALQMLNLANPVGSGRPASLVAPPSRAGDHLVAQWTSFPGGPYGCVGRVMLLELSRETGRRSTPDPARRARSAPTSPYFSS